MNDYRELLSKEFYTFGDLVAIMAILRGEHGCPWDREQTHASLRTCLLEETYEVAEAIDLEDPGLMREELGDLLMQVVLHAEIAREDGAFDIDDVADGICRKMLRRHPHVFLRPDTETAESVVSLWEEIKKEEKKERSTPRRVLDAVPPVFPALLRAQKLQGKAEKMGILPHGEVAIPAEWEETMRSLQGEEREAYLGKLLFAVTDFGRRSGVPCEDALRRTNADFVQRVAKEPV